MGSILVQLIFVSEAQAPSDIYFGMFQVSLYFLKYWYRTALETGQENPSLALNHILYIAYCIYVLRQRTTYT